MWVAGNWVKEARRVIPYGFLMEQEKVKRLTIRISTALGKGYGNGPEVKKVIKVK